MIDAPLKNNGWHQSLNDCVQTAVEPSEKVSVNCWFCWLPLAAAPAR